MEAFSSTTLLVVYGLNIFIAGYVGIVSLFFRNFPPDFYLKIP